MIECDQSPTPLHITISNDALSESVATFGVGPNFLVVTEFLDLPRLCEGGSVFRRKLLVPFRKFDIYLPVLVLEYLYEFG